MVALALLAGDWLPIQVKQKDRLGRPGVDSFEPLKARLAVMTQMRRYVQCLNHLAPRFKQQNLDHLAQSKD